MKELELERRCKNTIVLRKKSDEVSVLRCVYLFINVYLPTKHIYDILTIFIGSHVEQVDNNENRAGVLCKLLLYYTMAVGGGKVWEEWGMGGDVMLTLVGWVNHSNLLVWFCNVKCKTRSKCKICHACTTHHHKLMGKFCVAWFIHIQNKIHWRTCGKWIEQYFYTNRYQ